jgi:autotransporter-associated beta strand protein
MVPPKFVSPLRCATLMAAAMMIAGPAPEARAANYFWDTNSGTAGIGGAGTWDTATNNWFNNGLSTASPAGTSATTIATFTAADKAYFAGTGGTVTFATNPTLAGLVFRNAAFTIDAASARSITLGSSGISLESTSGITTLGANVGLVLDSNQTWTNATAANALIVNGVISGSAGLVLAGGAGGIQLLNAANTFTGPLTWSAGTLQVTKLADGGVASTIGAASSDAANLTLGIGTTFKWVGDGVLGTNDSTDRLFTLGALAGAPGGLTIDASPTGDTTKAVRFTNPGVLGLPVGDDTYVRTLTFTGTGGTVANPNLFASVIPDNGDTVNFISNTGLIKDGAGVWKLTGASTYAGPVQILNGTLIITNIQEGLTASGLGQSDAGNAGNNLILGGPTASGTLRYEGAGGVNNLTNRLFKINAGGATIDASGAAGTPLLFKAFAALGFVGTTARTLTLTGTNTDGNYLAQLIPDYSLAAPTSVVKNGPGTWLLKGTSTYTGGTTVNAGTLRMAEGYTAFGTGPIALNGGMLDLGTSVVETTQGANKYFTGTITVQGGELAALAGGSIDVFKVVGISGTISASMYSLTSGFSKNTGNTLVISGYNRYMGGTALSQGTVQVGHNFAFGSTAAQILVLSGAPTLSSASTTAYVLPNNLTLSAGAVLGDALKTGALTFTGTVDLGSSVRALTVNSDINFNGSVFGGGGGISKSGPGTLTLAAASSFSGGVTISGGRVRVGNNAALGSGPLVLNDTASLSSKNFTGAGVGDFQLANSLTLGGNVTLGHPIDNGILTFAGAIGLGASVTRVVTVNSDVAFTGAIASGASANLTKAGPGQLTLSNNNTFTGILAINAGTVRASVSAGALGSSTATLNLAGGSLQLANDSGVNFNRNTTVSASSSIVADRISDGAGVGYTLGTLSLGAFTLKSSVGNFVISGSTGVTFGAATLTGAATISTDNSLIYAATNTTTLASLTRTSQALTVSGTGNLTITGGDTTASSGTLTKNGTGTLTLGSSGSAIYAGTGGLTITGGTMVVGAGSSFSGSKNLTFGGTGLFQFNAATTGTTQNFGAVSFTAGGGAVQSVFTSGGNAALNFNALGARTNGADALFIVKGGANGTTNKITFTTDPWTVGTLKADYFFGTEYPTTTSLPADFAVYDSGLFLRAVNWGSDTTLANTVAASAALTTLKANWINATSGTSGTVTQATSVTINGLKLTGSATLVANGLINTPSILASQNTTSTINGSAGLTAPIGKDLIVRVDAPNDTLYINAPITSATTGGLTKAGQGTLVLAGANGFSGNIFLNGGTLSMSGNAYNGADPATGPLGAAGLARQIVLNGGRFQLSSGTFNPNFNTKQFTVGTAGGALDLGASAVIKLDDVGQLSGGGNLRVTGVSSSSVTFSNTNAGFTGNVAFTAGTLALGGVNPLGASASQTLVMTTNATALDVQGTIPNTLWIAGTGISSGGAVRSSATGGTLSGPLFLDASLTFNLANPVTVSGSVKQVGGIAGLTKEGNSILTLSGANNFTGGITINNGAVNLGNTAAAGPGNSALTLNSTAIGTALQLSGDITVYNSLTTGSGTNQLFGGINFGGILENVSGNNTYAGAIGMAIDTAIGSTSGNLTITGGIQENTKESQLYFTGAGNITLAGTKITASGGSTNNQFYSIQKYGTGTLTITNAQDVVLNTGISGGAFILRQGTVSLTDEATWRTALFLDQGSTLSIDHSSGERSTFGRLSTATNDINGNFQSGTAYNVTFRGGNLTINGSASPNDTAEYFSSGTFNRGSSVITLKAVNTNATRLRFNGAITNNVAQSQAAGPAGASLLIRGTNLGSSLGDAVLWWNGIITWNGQGGGNDTKNKGIMSWVLVDDTETGFGTSFGTADGGSSYARALNQQVYGNGTFNAGARFTDEYEAANVISANSNLHLTTQVSVPSTVSPNSLTVEAGAGLALATGTRLSLQSGGILIRNGVGTSLFTGGVLNQTSNFSPLYLWTVGNLDLVTPLNGGNGVANGNISAIKASPGTLALKPPLAAVNGLTTQGTNTLSGQFVINDGTVKLFANNAIQPNNYLALTSGTLDLNGKIQQTFSLFSDSSVPNVNGTITSTVGGALVMNQDNNPRAWSGQIQAATTFVRSGQNTFTLNSVQPFTGKALFNGGTTNLISEAALTGVDALDIAHATLQLDNGGSASSNTISTKYVADRLRDGAAVGFRTGTLNLFGRANVAATETIGAVTLSSGFNVINVNNGANGAVYSTELLMTSFARSAGSAATFILQSNATLGGAGIGDVRAKATSFEGGAGLTNGIVGGWAINNSDFLTYVVGTGFVMLGNNSTSYTTTALPSGSFPASNVRLTGGGTVASGTTVINALSLAGQSQSLNFANDTATLNLVSGGLIGTNANDSLGASVDSGRLTAGGASPAAPSDLYLFNRVNTMTLNARVIDNPIGGANAPVRLVITAAGGAFNLPNTLATYTGGTVINGGTVNLIASTTGAVIPAAAVAANGLVLNGATVNMGSSTNTVSGQIAAANIVTLNGSSILNLFGNNSLAGLVFNNYGGSSNPSVRTFFSSHPAGLGSTGVLTLGAAGIVATSQNVGTVAMVEGRVDFAYAGALVPGTVTVDPIAGAGLADISPLLPGLTLQAIVGSGLGITKNGNGVLQMGAQSSFTGPFTVAAGGLRNGVLNAGSRYSTLTVAGGARYDLANFSTTWGALSGAGDIFNSTLAGAGTQVIPTLHVGYNNTDSIFSGRFQRFNDAVIFNVAKVGSGTLALTSAQTTAGTFGTFSVLGGTLSYAGAAGQAFVATTTAASNFIVSNGGTLLLDNSSANLADRLGLANAGFLALQGGKLRVAGNTGVDTVETVKLLKVQSGGGRIELAAASGRSVTLALGGLTSSNNSGSLVITGIDGQDPVASGATLTILSVPYQGSPGFGSNGDTNMKVRGDILVDAVLAGYGTGFLVQDSDTYNFRALNSTTELNTDYALLGKRENAGLSSALTYAGDLQMNTLTSSGTSSLTSSLDPTTFGAYGPGGRLLTIGLYNASGVLVRANAVTTLNGGAVTSEGTTYFHVLNGATLNLNASYGVGGSAGFVKAADGILNVNRRAYMAPFNLIGGYTALESDIVSVNSTAGLSVGSLVTGAGIPANSFVAEILPGGTQFRITTGEGVVTAGSPTTVITATPAIHVNGGTLNLNSGADNTLAVAGLAGPAGLSTLFINAPLASVDLKGNSQAVAVLGSTNILPGMGGTITNSSVTAALLTSAGGGSFGGVIGGNLAFTRSGNSTTLLTHANTYTGETIVRGGTLHLRDAGTLASTAGLKVYYGAVNWDNYGLNPVGVPTPTRLQATNAVTLQGGAFILTGSGGTDTVVTLNSVTAAGGGNLINMQPYINEGSSVKLTIGNLVRNATNRATFNLNGWTTLNSGGTNTLGSQGLSNTSNLFFSQVGGVTFNSGSLVNGLIGGWAVADGNAFATYTDTFGVVSLGNGWGYSTSFTGDLTSVNNTTATGNYNDGTSRTMSSGVKAMNSLRISTGSPMTVTPVNGTSYTFGVGIVTNAGQPIIFEAVDNTNTISGTGSELFVYINQNTTTLKPIITGAASLVSFGGATLQLAPQFGHNTYSGGTFVNSGTLNLSARAKATFGGLTINPTSTVISMGNTTGFTAGMIIVNGNFPVGTKVLSVSSGVSITVDTPSTNGSASTGQTVSTFEGWYAIPATGGLTIGNASVNMSATAFQQIDPATAITMNGGGNLTLANYVLGNAVTSVPITQTFASLTFMNEGGAFAPTFNLGNPSAASGTNQPLSITQLTSATPLTATNNSLSTTPTVSTGNAGNTELRFSAVSPVITVNSGLAETGLVISAVIGQSVTMTSLTKVGNGLLALTGQNNFTSNFLLNAGGLMLGADSLAAIGLAPASGPVGSGTLIINGGYLLSDGLPRTVNNAIMVNADFAFGGNVATTNLKLSGDVALGAVARTVTVTSPAVTAELAGNLTSTFATVGGTAFTKAGPGTLKLSGPDNDFNGKKVAITGGLLVIGVSTAIPSTSSVDVSAGAGLDLFNLDLIIPQLTGAGFVTNSKNLISTLTVGDAGNFTFGGILIDNSYSTGVTGSELQLTKEGTGKMTLTGINLLTGGINVNNGILELGAGGLPGPSTITINNNAGLGIFQINRADNITLTNDLAGNGKIYHVGTGVTTLTGAGTNLTVGSLLRVFFGGVKLGDGVGSTGSLGGATVTVETGTFLDLNHSAASPFAFANAVDGAGELRHSGGSTTTLLVANTYTGKTRINAGILIAGADGALASTNEIILLTGTQLKTEISNGIGFRDGGITSPIAPALTLYGTALVDGNAFNSTIGLLTLNGGTVAGAGTGFTDLGSFNLAGNVVVTADATISAIDVNTDGTNRNFTVNSGITLSMSGNFADTDKASTGYAKIGSGTMVLSGTNINTGAITISAGTLQVGAGSSTGTLGSYYDNIALLTYWAPVANNSALVINRTGTYDLGNVISGAGTLTNTGAGTVMLTADNVDFSGTTTITAGTLQIGNQGATGVLGGTSGVYGAIVNNAALVLKRTGTLTLGNAISGTGTVTNVGTGRVVLTGNNTYTGTTTLAAGFTRITSLASAGGVGSLGAGSAPSKLLFTGGTLEYNGVGETSQRGLKVADGGASLSAIQSGAAVVFGAGVALDFDNTTPATSASRPLILTGTSTAANTFALSAFESETAGLAFSSLTKNLTGVWIVGGSGLLNANAPVNVTAGLLGFASNALGGVSGTGDVTIAHGATLRWESGNINDLSGRINVPAAATATLDFADTGATPTTFASSMVLGTGASIVKAGAGTLVFAAANSFTTPVTVSGGKLVVSHASGLGTAAVTVQGTGKLQVNAITTNNITVDAGGSAGGSGSVGLVTVNNTGAVAPGSGVGALSLSTLALTSGSVINWQVYNVAGPAGVGYDTLNLSGAFDVQGANPVTRIRLNVISVAGLGTDTQGNAGLFNKNQLGVFTFAVAQGGVTLNSSWQGTNISNYFDINVDQFRYSDGSASSAGLWSLTFDGANTVTLTGVPEPSTYGLAIGALGLALAAIRRRRKLKPKAE